MTVIDDHGDGEPVTEKDLNWSLPVSARPERIPPQLLTMLSYDQLLAHNFSQQDDIETLRLAYHEALTALAELTRKVEKVTERYHDALTELRRLREDRTE